MASTLKEIAKLAGVSHATVSKALSGRYSVHPGTRERILALAEELNYQPSGFGRALVSGKTRCVGIYFNQGQLPSGSFSSLFKEANHLLQDRGYHAMLMTRAGDRDPIPPAIRSRMVDGVIICHSRDIAFEALVSEMGLSAVLLNTEPTRDGDCVVADNEAGINLAIKHLIELGHSNIAFVNSPYVAAHVSQGIRADGYVRAMANAGLRAYPGSELNRPVADAIDHFFGDDMTPTAIVCFNDMVAMSVIHELNNRSISVPKSVSVIGCDDEQEAVRYFNPPLTTLRMPFNEMGVTAVNFLLSRLIDDEEAPRFATLPLELVERASTAPPFVA